MAFAASVHDYKIRNVQNTLTVEGLQQRGTPTSQMSRKHAHQAAPVRRLLDKGEETDSEHKTQRRAK